MPNSAQLRSSWPIWAAACAVEDRQVARGRGHRVVRRRDRLARAPHLQAALPQPGERLRAGDLVDEVQVDREDGGRARLFDDDVVVPDLLDEGARSGHDGLIRNGGRGGERSG